MVEYLVSTSTEIHDNFIYISTSSALFLPILPHPLIYTQSKQANNITPSTKYFDHNINTSKNVY